MIHHAAASTLLFCVLAAGCRSPWENHDASQYETFKTPNAETVTAHAELLRALIESAEKANVRPPPGICAEYAFYQAKLGRLDDAESLLTKEEQYYPEAKVFLTTLRRYLPAVTPVASSKATTSAK